MPFFSIITVCYNSGKTLRRTLEAMLAQDCKDYEYLIVDGASRDDTLDILREYEPRFEGRLCWKSEPDGGIYEAMNKGISRARGAWIGIINSDDEYLPGALSAVHSAITQAETPPDVVYSDMDYVDEQGHVTRHVEGDINKLWKGMFVNHPTCFVRKELYERFGGFDTSYRVAADYELMQRFAHKEARFLKCGQNLAVLHVGGVSDRNFAGEVEKYHVQRKYYSLPLCGYLLLRGVYACKLRPRIQKFRSAAKKPRVKS